MNTDFLYWYEADVIKVVDGDTVDVRIRLGVDTERKERLRLSRIDAWETKGANERVRGLEAAEWLEEQIKDKRIIINTQLDKEGKYGRLCADLYIGRRCLNDELVELGHAEYKEY